MFLYDSKEAVSVSREELVQIAKHWDGVSD